jgi:hypothetical protein
MLKRRLDEKRDRILGVNLVIISSLKEKGFNRAGGKRYGCEEGAAS